MKNLIRFLVLGTAIVLVAALIVPAVAQDVTPGEGGIIIEGNFGGDPATFNPILASDTTSTRVTGFLFPAFLGVDPATALFRKEDPAALATDWTISEDGLTYTSPCVMTGHGQMVRLSPRLTFCTTGTPLSAVWLTAQGFSCWTSSRA
jgi:ABC-type transport system substrate-binding protein